MFYTIDNLSKNFVIHLEPIEDFGSVDNIVVDKDKALYQARSIKVYKITDKKNNEEVDHIGHIKINETYDYYSFYDYCKKENTCTCYKRYIYFSPNIEAAISSNFCYDFDNKCYPKNTFHTGYHSNGVIRCKKYYNNKGLPEGLHEEFDEKGNLTVSENYDENGELHGIYRYYFDNGNLMEETNYNHGKVISRISFWYNRNIEEEKTEDKLFYYYEEGMKYLELDKKTRISTTFLKNGEIVSQVKLDKSFTPLHI